LDTAKTIQYLLNPRSIALLGCSENNVAGTTLLNLQTNGYAGKLYPVHPKNESVLGVKCYKSLMDIPDEVDVCVVGLRSTYVLATIEEMHKKGVKAAVIFASGFAETGAAGQALEKQVAEKLAEYGIAACGPNCLGLINVDAGVTLYSAPCNLKGVKGPIGLVSHSGSICIAFMSAARGSGFSYFVSCGNEAGLSVSDYFRAMIEDDNTQVIVGFLEAIRDPEGLKEVARLAVEKNKPIIILKVGRSEIAQKTASAHSGALASAADVTDAFFKQNHILQAKSFDEINEACELLLELKDQPIHDAFKVGMTAISGGQLGFCSDVAFEEGVEFGSISEKTVKRISSALPDFATAKNPLDVTTALFDTDAYKECVRALAADDSIGMVLVCQDTEEHMCADEIALYRHIVQALCEVRKEIDKPMAVFSPLSAGLVKEYPPTFAAAGIPLLQGAHESMHAVKLYFDWMRIRQEAKRSPARDEHQKVDFSFGDHRSLSERESKQLLSAYGIDVAKDVLVSSADAAVQAATAMGFPVVLKIDSPDILHKTEAKVVRLNLQSAEQVRAAYAEIVDNARAYNPVAHVNGVSVQEMVPGGVEILLGVKQDPIFGPAVMVGIGGIFVEVFKDYALRLAPLDLETAREMIDALKGKKLLYGARGAAPADVDALADALVRLGHLAKDHADEIREMDINPLIVLEKGKGVKAVDALVVLKDKN
jgi:acetate---CoA ligase (ADP-forming)